jgi:DNA-binding response OmpR family regulator
VNTILVVDDEPALLATIAYNLRKEGHQVLTAADGALALDVARREQPDLVVLDLLLPKVDGLEVCRTIRQSPAGPMRTVPILMLTAKTDEVDKVVGLELGADDYVTKPFSMRELLARVKAMLRRSRMEDEEHEAELPAPVTFGDLTLDVAQRRVLRKGKDVAMKPKEFDLLSYLMRNPGQVFSREQLLDHVWGYGHVADIRTVDVHVRWLREKIEKHPSKPKLLETVRGVGYRLHEPEPEKVEKAAKKSAKSARNRPPIRADTRR